MGSIKQGQTNKTMAQENQPIQYVISERKATVGSLAGKTILTAVPTNRQRISFRNLCDEVARNTTFARQEVQAVIQLAFEVAKAHVENGESVELGDFGTISPSFKSVQVEKKGEGTKAFDPAVHITKPVVRFNPSRKYFELRGVRFERVDGKLKATDKPKASQPSTPKTEGGNPDGMGL